jgi:hypothetical protein
MDREYMDEVLLRLATIANSRAAGWGDQEISDFRVLVQCARAAQVDTDLRNWHMLRIEPDETGDPNKARAILSSGRLIGLTFKNTESHGAVVFELLTAERETER